MRKVTEKGADTRLGPAATSNLNLDKKSSMTNWTDQRSEASVQRKLKEEIESRNNEGNVIGESQNPTQMMHNGEDEKEGKDNGDSHSSDDDFGEFQSATVSKPKEVGIGEFEKSSGDLITHSLADCTAVVGYNDSEAVMFHVNIPLQCCYAFGKPDSEGWENFLQEVTGKYQGVKKTIEKALGSKGGTIKYQIVVGGTWSYVLENLDKKTYRYGKVWISEMLEMFTQVFGSTSKGCSKTAEWDSFSKTLSPK